MSQRRRESALNFEETYNGFGEHELEENDYLNDETFGADIEVGTDFDFGHPGKAATNNNVPAQASVMPQRSYVTAASSGINKPGQQNVDASMDLKPMESLWGVDKLKQDRKSLYCQWRKLRDSNVRCNNSSIKVHMAQCLQCP